MIVFGVIKQMSQKNKNCVKRNLEVSTKSPHSVVIPLVFGRYFVFRWN